ncbi:MAG TPA: RNA 2',3'-cyclic phosphodiesterase [Ilumatobacteraceae bacterium]
MARLFIAVWPPENVLAELARLNLDEIAGIRPVRPETWHITMRFLGNAESDDVRQALAGARLAPAHARLGPGLAVIAGRVLAVSVAGLDALAATVTDLTAGIGKPARQPFRGHLTLARVKAPTLDIGNVVFSGHFDVKEIALVASRTEADGAHYQTIDTWPVG